MRRASAATTHDDGCGGDERDEHGLEQPQGDDVAEPGAASGPVPDGPAGAQYGVEPVARNRRASTQGAPA